MTTRTTLPRRTILAMAASAFGLSAASRAGATVVLADLIDFRVVERETGEPARVWRHAGRLFVAGRPGARYSLRVSNNTGGRVLAVMSVDGVNILTGETAGYDQRGYVFGPYETYDIRGWRKSDTQVAAFTFAALSQSYAARTGRPNDVGVIGVAAFRERAYPPVAVAPAAPMAESRSRADNEVEEAVVTQGRAGALRAPPPPSARSQPSDQLARRRSEKLGTGHGEREWSAVTQVAFERATAYPQMVRRIEYDSYPNLVAMGVIRQPPIPQRPQPFPSSPGYVPDPPGGR